MDVGFSNPSPENFISKSKSDKLTVSNPNPV